MRRNPATGSAPKVKPRGAEEEALAWTAVSEAIDSIILLPAIQWAICDGTATPDLFSKAWLEEFIGAILEGYCE